MRVICLFFLFSLIFGCVGGSVEDMDSVVHLDVIDANQLILDNFDRGDFVVLDVRTQKEFDSGHIENAVLIDYYKKDFRSELEKLDKSKKYLVYCRTGRRSKDASNIMASTGFTKVYNMNGGVTSWQRQGFELK